MKTHAGSGGWQRGRARVRLGRSAVARWAVLVAFLTALATGCSLVGGHGAAPPSRATATVSPGEAAYLSTPFAQVLVPAAAVSTATTARVGQRAAKDSAALLFPRDYRATLEAAKGVRPISVDLSGQQPLVPLRLRFPTPDKPAGEATLFLATSHQGRPQLLAVTDLGNGWSEAALPHLSLFTPVWLLADKVLDLAAATFNEIARTFTQGEGENTSSARCTPDPVTLSDGSEVTVERLDTAPRQARGTPLALCLSADGTGVAMTVDSDDATPWRVATDPGGQWRRNSARSADEALVAATYQLFVNELPGEGMVRAFGAETWDLLVPADGEVVVSATVSAEVYLVTVAAFGVAMLGAVYAGGVTKDADTLDRLVKAAVDSEGATDCLVGAFGSMADAVGEKTLTPESLHSAGMACTPQILQAADIAVGSYAQAVVSILVSIATQGIPLLVGSTNGIYRTLTGSNMDWLLTRSSSPGSGGGGGNGTARGGFPDIPDGSWGSNETELRVRSDGSVWLLSEGTSCQPPLEDADASGCQQIDQYQVTGDRDISGDGTEMDVRAEHLSSGYYAMNWPSDGPGPSVPAGPKVMGEVEPDSDIGISFFDDASSVVVYNPMPTAFCAVSDDSLCS